MNIGFIGEMASGKTQMAQYFLKKYGGQRVSFADALKRDIIEFNLTIDGTIQKPRDRKIMQEYGQLRRAEVDSLESNNHVLRNENGIFFLDDIQKGSCHPDHWLNTGLRQSLELAHQKINPVFDDIRFVNEVKSLMAHNFVVIRTYATKEVRIQRLLSRDGGYNEKDFSDVSETETKYLPLHYMIDNNGSLEDSYETLDIILSRLTNH